MPAILLRVVNGEHVVCERLAELEVFGVLRDLLRAMCFDDFEIRGLYKMV